MIDTAITVAGLGKSYLVGHASAQRRGYGTLRDTLSRGVRDLARKTRDMVRGRPIVQGDEVEEFWALKDVSFEVSKGDVVGIIGRNGAGKSTLLKVLSRITEPTTGRVALTGRVASLLEVGTGFHPELSGRENVFLNGAILGMGRGEILSKFDEIVAFADVDRFIDTPVKRYSSGMYMRLAFSIAAHLEPEILVIDEVLAVGDQQFQQKCLGKIGDVASGGRTVLVVSHNMAVVSSLCTRAMLLSSGRLVEAGPTASVLESYSRLLQGERSESRGGGYWIDKCLQLVELRCEPDVVPSGSSTRIILSLRAPVPNVVDELALLVYASSGERVAILDLRQPGGGQRLDRDATITWEVSVQSLPLVEGEYSLGVFCRTRESRGNHYDLGHLTVTPGKSACTVVPYAAQHRGVLELDFQLSVDRQ